jgi:hypothetical protein
VTCPTCHTSGIRRGELSYHQNTECPETAVQCPYGCGESFLRKELETHYKERIHIHLDLLRLSFQSELKKLRQEYESELLVHRSNTHTHTHSLSLFHSLSHIHTAKICVVIDFL